MLLMIRKKGTKHSNSKAEIIVHGSDDKKDLTSTPFIGISTMLIIDKVTGMETMKVLN